MNLSYLKGPADRRRLVLMAGAVIFAIAGCGGAGKGTITGAVTYNNQPVSRGTITFTSEKGNHEVIRADITDGKYTTAPIESGPAKVSIVATPPPRVVGANPSGAPAAAAPHAGAYVAIPAKYANVATSGLTYDVKSGSQTKDFPLP